MTVEAYLYLIPGLIAFFWPLVTLFFKREVMEAQWLLMGALSMAGICMMLYSTFFIDCFRHEHLLCHLYVMMALFTPAVMLAGVVKLTSTEGYGPQIRNFLLLPVSSMVLITLVAQLGGWKNYQLFLATAVHGGDLSLRGDFWYDALLVVEYFGFLGVLGLEVLLLVFIALPNIRKYATMLKDNFVEHTRTFRRIRIMGTVVAVVIILLVLLQVNYPLHYLSSRFMQVLVSVAQSFVVFVAGYFVYHLRHSAEQLEDMQHDAEVVSDQFRKLGLSDQLSIEQVAEDVRAYLEDSKGCLDPTVSVFKIARQFHVNQDVVVHSIHLLKGCSFAEYVNSLRIEYALGVVMERLDGGMRNDSDYERLRFTDSLAASCGYSSAASFYIGFAKVMGQPFDTWMTAMVETQKQATAD